MVVGIIPAKGNSKRLFNKNMSSVLGKPMIYWTIKYSLSYLDVNNLFVSTDSKHIAKYSKNFGIRVIDRPDYLLDEAPIIEVYRHAIEYLENNKIVKKVSTVIGLQPDHPDRKNKLTDVFEVFQKNKLDRLMSKDKMGNKNGAHYILSRRFINSGKSISDQTIIDDCTNVHYEVDLIKAENNLELI